MEGGAAMLSRPEDGWALFQLGSEETAYDLSYVTDVAMEWLTQAILHHHDYGALTGTLLLPDESCSLIACAAITDHILTERLFARLDAEWERALPAVGDYLNLAPQAVEDLLEDVQVQVEAQQRQRESLQPRHDEDSPA